MNYKNFAISEWRPITTDEFVHYLHEMQREASLKGLRVEMQTSDVCRNQFATEFNVEGTMCKLLLLHASLETGTEQLPFRRRG